ncbi:hypothetical protein HK102_004040, partial [Quaeritorhiza haematococci]
MASRLLLLNSRSAVASRSVLSQLPKQQPLALLATRPYNYTYSTSSSTSTLATEPTSSSSNPDSSSNPTRGSSWSRLATFTTIAAVAGAVALGTTDILESESTSPFGSSTPKSSKPRLINVDGLDLPVVQSWDDDPSGSNLPKLVILGSGWGSTSLLKDLEPGNYDTIVISPSNYFVFTPLLPEATTGTVEARSLTESIRKICKGARARYVEAEATDVRFDKKMVHVTTGDGRQFLVPYDKLVVAVGAKNQTLGVPGVEENTHFLKTVSDARKIRYRIMSLFEKAALPCTTDEERKQLLSFVIAGGGPTGVEFAAELYDFLSEDLMKYFPDLMPHVRVSIIQSADHILNTYSQAISEFAESRFKRQNIDVITRARVVKVEKDQLVYRKKDKKEGDNDVVTLPFGLCVWSTGVGQREISKKLLQRLPEQGNKRALEVDRGLRLKGVGDVYAMGDCSTIENPKMLKVVMDRFKKIGAQRLSFDEFESVAHEIMDHYPQTRIHLRQMEELFETYDKDRSGYLEVGEIQKMLTDIDKKLTSLPATAQVAAQQGSYLASKFNTLSNSTSSAPSEKKEGE